MKRRVFIQGIALTIVGTGRVLANKKMVAISGDRLSLFGKEMRLVDVLAPSINDPFGEQARVILQSLLFDSTELQMIETFVDRWGRSVGYLQQQVNEENIRTTIQAKLVMRGAVRVNPEADDHTKIEALQILEQDARRSQRGLWALPDYKIYDARDKKIPTNKYSLFQGRVVEARVRGSRYYLNFGDDWRIDATATLTKRQAKRWQLSEDVWEALAGKTVLARGFIEKINGPSIDLLHPLQLTLIGSDGAFMRPPFSAPETLPIHPEHSQDRDYAPLPLHGPGDR